MRSGLSGGETNQPDLLSRLCWVLWDGVGGSCLTSVGAGEASEKAVWWRCFLD